MHPHRRGCRRGSPVARRPLLRVVPALAEERGGFDWRGEAWETLTHELRHHLEWKANTQDLEEYDWAADQGFARADDEAFDPVFFLAGDLVAPDTYEIDDDVFYDRVVRELPEIAEIEWRGRCYSVKVPSSPLPLYLSLQGLEQPPAGDVIVVFRRKPGLLDLLRSRHTRPTERRAEVDSCG